MLAMSTEQQQKMAGRQQSMNELGASVYRSLDILHQLHGCVSDFSESSQLHLLERLNGLQKELTTMHSLADNCSVPIPLEVVQLIDEGGNPDEFSKDLLNNCFRRNQATKGKVDAMRSLRKNLLEEIDQAFPEEAETYRLLRSKAGAAAGSQQLPLNGDVRGKS